MSPITTDYTDAENPNSLTSGSFSNYRLMHWMRDVLMNFMSDPINIKDERLCKLLCMQNGATETQLNALFRVGLPYDGDVVKAGTTPVILVSLGDVKYPVNHFNSLSGPITSEIMAMPDHGGLAWKTVDLHIAIATESYDGTVLLAGILEEFLLMNAEMFPKDNRMISDFRVVGIQAPQKIETDQAGNAREIYQTVITVSTVGGFAWSTDTQGPVFRGIQVSGV